MHCARVGDLNIKGAAWILFLINLISQPQSYTFIAIYKYSNNLKWLIVSTNNLRKNHRVLNLVSTSGMAGCRGRVVLVVFIAGSRWPVVTVL